MDTAVALQCWYWVVPETIHTPPTEEIFAVQCWRRRGEQLVSDNNKCIRTSKESGGGGGYFYFLHGGEVWMFFLE